MTLCPWGTLDLLQGAYFYHLLSEGPYSLGPGQDIPAPAFNPQHIATSCGSRKDFAADFVSTFPHLLGQPSCKAGITGAVVWVGVFLFPSLFVGKRLSNSVNMFPLQKGPRISSARRSETEHEPDLTRKGMIGSEGGI